MLICMYINIDIHIIYIHIAFRVYLIHNLVYAAFKDTLSMIIHE